MRITLTLLCAFALILAAPPPAFAQAPYSASASGSTTAAGEINSKPAFQIDSSGLACTTKSGTAGKDVCFDTAASPPTVYFATVTGAPATWTRIVSTNGNFVNPTWLTLTSINGTSVPTNSAADQVLGTTASATGAWISMVNCVAAGGVVQYAIASHTFSCHTLVNADMPVVDRAHGGFNSTSAGTGLLRDGTTPAASELSGDATTSGSNAVTVTKLNNTTPGGTCTNQFVRSLSASAVPTCATVANADLTNAATTVNGQTCTLGSSCTVPLSAINPQTSTYQVLAADFSNYKTITVASGTFTVTLVASGSQPANGQYINIVNYGSGIVTVTRSGQNINGGTSSLTLAAGSATAPTNAVVWSDGANYFASVSGSATLAGDANGAAGANLVTKIGGTTITASSIFSSLHGGGTTYNNPLPCFKVATVSYTELIAAATSQQIDLATFTEPVAFSVMQVEETTQFTSGSGTVTALAVSVGGSSTTDFYMPSKALMQTAGTINAATPVGGTLAISGSHTIYVRVAVTNTSPGNLGNASVTNLTAGTLTIRACVVTLQ